MDQNIKQTCRDKLKYRQYFADKLSVCKFNYILATMKRIFNNKITTADPSAFKDKIKIVDKKEERDLKRQGSHVS